MAQPSQTDTYRPITSGNAQYGLDQDRIRKRKLELEDAAVQKRRKQALDAFLSDYEDDPVSKAFATLEFESQETERQKEVQKLARQKERDAIANEYPDDPLMQAWVLEERDIEKTKNIPQKQAFAEQERIEQIDKRESDARKLERFGMGNAFVRETLGAGVAVVPGLAAGPARVAEAVGLVEPGTTTELYKQADAFQAAQDVARQDDMSPWLSRMYGGSMQSFMQMGATPGGAGAKILGAGLMSGNEALHTADEAGLTGAAKWRYAGTQGLLEAGIAALGQKVFGGGVESRLAGQAVAAETWKQLGKNIGMDALKEMPEEALTAILQDVSSKFEGVSPDLQFGDFVRNATEAAVQAAMMAGIGNVPNAAKLAMPGRKTRAPEIEAFVENPSRKKYEAAVKAGMPPVEDGKSTEGRAKYAEEIRKQVPPAAPPLEAQQSEAVSDDEELSRFIQDLEGGDPNEEAVSQGQPEDNGRAEVQGGQEAGQGQQEELLIPPLSGMETPSGIDGMAAPAVPNESALPVASTREEFEKQYRDTFEKLMQYPPDQAGSQLYAEQMGQLYDSHPDWADEIESTIAQPQSQTPPVVASGGTSPDQPAPSQAGPVSETAVSEQASTPEPQAAAPEAPRRGIIGDMLATGEVVQTSSGRATTPFPKIATDTSRKLAATLRRAEEWLQSNALAEAEARGDEFNALQFRNEKPGKMPKATKDAMEEYLFGEQPKVVPSVLKPVATAPDKTVEQPKRKPQQPAEEQPKAPQKTAAEAQPWKDATVEDESRWFGTTVTVHPPSKRDKPYKGTVVRVLNSGELVEVRPLRNKNGESFRVKSSAIVVDELVDNRPREDAKPATGGVSVIESPDLQLERQRTEDADKRKQAIEDGGFVVGDRVTQPSTGRKGVLQAISDTYGTVSVKFDEDGSVLSGTDVSGFVRDESAPKPQSTEPAAETVATDDDIKAAIRAEKKRREEEKAAQQKPVSENRATPEILRERISDADNYAQIVKSVGDDAANDLFVKLTDPDSLAKRPSLLKYDPDKPFVPWAVMVARNLKKDAEAKARKALGEPLADEESIPEKKKRSGLGEKTAELSAKTGARRKKVIEDALKKLNDMEILTGPGVNMKAVGIVVDMAEALITDGVVKFADFIVAVVEVAGEATTRKLSRYLEMAWDVSRETNPELDPAGKVADVLGAEKEVTDEKRPERDESTGDGGRETADRPVGEKRVEEASSDDVSADAEGGDAGRSGATSGGRSDGETSGTVSNGDEGAGSVPSSPAGDDRTAGRSGRIDYRITGADQIGEKFNPRERFDKNVEAIRVLKQIEAENRRATPDEQKVLAQYVGWGGLKEAFSTRADQGLREKAILKDLLTEKELAQARTSVRNAHYTSPEVISAMWEGLTDAGFAGGRILEPSSGIGHFYGLVPESVAAVSQLSGIEMDSLTARIAQQLYQTADIEHAMYQNVNVKNLQDLVISNVPFGQYKIKDKHDKSLKRLESVHNFFFLKALKNVRPGGVVAFITSRYTMDSIDPAVREKIAAAGGRFVGAVRLPNNAFMGIAKTKVTTDVIFIQKDAGDAQPWRNTKENAAGFVFNEYFHDHPENVLGKIDPKGGTQIGEWGVAPDGHDIGKELAQNIAAMPFDRAALAENSTEGAQTVEDVAEDADVPDGRLAIRDNKLFKAVGGKLEEVPLWGGERGQERKFAIIREMGSLAAVRDKLSELEMSPLATDAEIERARKSLNTAYDRFVNEHGFIHKGENQGLFRPDEQLPTLLALEEWDTDTKTAKKADVFEKRVQRPSGSATTPTTAEGAAVESYARLGRIDLPMMSEWLGKSESQVEQELTGWAYKDPTTGEWSLKNVYLSGNIAKKLKEAEAAAKDNPAFQKNVEDLKRVLPPRKTAGQIHVRPRSPFITADQYQQFMRHLGVNGTVRHEEVSGAWLIDNPHIEDPVKAGPWGVGRKTASDLLDGLLNNKPPVVWMTKNGNRAVDEAATQLARAKAKEIEDEFGRWVFSEPERAKQIEDGFNDTVGAFIEGEWDGSHLTLPGMNINITLLPHQLNAIWRAIVSGNTLLAHEVGLGKTFIMAAIAMERKRLGLVTNQMFVVPNHLLSQWASEFKALYPSAKLLALESDQINSTNRRTLMERVKSGRFDAIIVTPEAYKKMPMSNEIVEAKLNEITQKIEDTIREAKKAKGENRNFVAKLEAVLESIRGKMSAMLNDPAKDAGAKFDELGIDSIYVDEAHEYRNLWSMTQMGDISGVGLEGNQKTFDMLLKTDYLNQKTNNRGIVFATGTPIANSISELYSMQRYLQPHTLAEAGVASFDDWANTFGEAVTDIEVDPTGSGFRSKTRFKEFRNTIALSKIFRQVADVKYAEDVGLDKVRPKLRGGKLHAIQVMPSVGLLQYVRNLVRRLEISKKRNFDKRIDNPLKVTTDGRKAALDMRLVVPEEDGISSKINIAVENVARIYREEEERKGVQLLWVNLGTPASTKKTKKTVAAQDPDADQTSAKMDSDEAGLESGLINAYEDIKQKLIAQGIPENEIAFIHDYQDKDRKRALFQKARDGKVRILISTVKKLATGANIQTRLTAMHFYDPPWKPADIEQALGRAIRRGNLYKDWGGVQAFTYVTRGSFDAYIWQLLENKAKAIKQIMRGESDSVEDTGRIELNADEVKALASSNPKVLELVKVRNDVGQLRAEYYGYRAEQGNVQSDIAHRTGILKYAQTQLDNAEAELKTMPSRDDLHSGFNATIGDKTYSKRSEIGAAMVEAMPVIDATDKDKSVEQIKELANNPIKIGSVLGKPIFAGRGIYDGSARIIIGNKNGDWFQLSDDNTGNGVKLFNFFDKKYDEPGRLKKAMAEGKQELAALESRAGIPWPKSEQLTAGEESLRRLESELGSEAGKKGDLPVVSALTKYAIMAEKLGRQEGRPVTFDGTQWMHGDRNPVKSGAVTTEMEMEVDREVALLLVESNEKPHESFFFHKSQSRKAAEKTRAELSALQLMNRQYDKVIKREVGRIVWGRGSTAWTGIPLTPELSKALAGRMLNAVKIGIKKFELFILELRKHHDDQTINGLRPNIMRMWNGSSKRHGLDEATDEIFDAAMAGPSTADMTAAIEAGGETPEAPAVIPEPATTSNLPETELDDEPTIGIKKEKRAERREELGLDEEDLVSTIGHSFPELDAEAKQVSPGEAEDVFTRIGEGGEAADNASDRDVFVMLNHYAKKQMATRQTQDELEAARKSGDDFKVAELEAKLSVQVAEEVRLMAIAKSAGTASGRALGAFRAILKHDLSLARLRMRLDAAADGKPTDAQTREQMELHAKYEAALKELETKTKEAEEATTRAEIAEQIARDMEANSSTGKTKADRRLAAAWKPFRKADTFFSVTGAFQMLPEFIELAGAHIEKGVETFSDFIDKVSKHFGRKPKPETVPVLQHAWDVAWDNEKNPKSLGPPKVSIEPDHPDSLVSAAKALFRFFLSQGITETDAVIDAVHEELQNQFPGAIGERLDTMKAMVDYDKTRALSQDPLDILAADKRAIVQLKAKIEDMKRGIAPRRFEQRYPVSDEQRAHIKLFNEEKRKGGFVVTDPDRQAKTALASLETRLRHAISDTLNEIANGTRTVPDKTAAPTSDTTEDLQAYLALVRGMHKEIFGDRTMTQEQRLKAAEAAAVKNEAYWNDRLSRAKAGDFSTGKTKPNPVTNANIDAIKARTELAKAQVQELKELANPKPDPEAISDARYLTSLEKQLAVKLARIADIMARAAAGDFAPERNVRKEKREANAQRRKSDANIRDARIKLDEATKALNEQIEQVKKKNLTYVDLALRVPGAAWSTLRDLKLTGELSFILRQGGPRVFGVMVPAGKIARAGLEALSGNTDAARTKLKQAGQGYKQLGTSLGRTLKAALWKTDTELARSMDALRQRPNYKNGTYEAMRLSLHEDGSKFSVAEELFINNLVELGGLALDKRFPGFKGFRDGHPVFAKIAHNLNLVNRLSNATKVFMNEMRADMADDAAALWTMKSGEMTPAEARSLGNVVNAFTGKGDMSLIGMEGKKAQNFLSKLLISAPWLMSRLQLVTGQPLWSKGRTPETQKAAAEMYVDMAAGVAAYYGAFVLAGMFMDDDDDERPVVEWDSTSSDFMKVRIGKTRMDPLFGLQQVIVLMSRILHDEIKDSRGVVRKRKGFEDDWALISRFQEGRLHPGFQDIRAFKTGKDFMGQPITKTEAAIGTVLPITYPAIVEASKRHGIPASIAMGLWAIAGGGLATYESRTKERADLAEELSRVQRKLTNPNTPADVRKSLQGDADAMIESHLINAVKSEASGNGDTALVDQAASYKPGNTMSPELTAAIQNEKGDLVLRASELLSSEDTRTKDKKSPVDDLSITTARELLKALAPKYEDANRLYSEAYERQNKTSTTEIVGGRRQPKPNVAAARKRLKSLYPK